MILFTKRSLQFVTGVLILCAIATDSAKCRKIELQDNPSAVNQNKLDETPLSSLLDDKILSLNRQKRMIFDSSCKGIYDRKLFGKLDRVCDDCYNLFRKPHIATECRQDCFSHKGMFLFCVHELGLDVNKYEEYANLIRKKSSNFNKY